MNADHHTCYTLITGAGAGIGKALAEESAKKGRNLLLIALPGEDLAAFSASLAETYGIETNFLEIDLTGARAPAEVFGWCIDRKFRVDGLINNAGVGYTGFFEKFDHAFYAKLISLNTTALILLTRLFLPELKRHNPAYILNVGSMGSFVPVPYKAVYAASKAFVYSFSLALKRELKGSSVRVALLCPGAVPTNEDVLSRIEKDRVLTRMALTRAEDVARIALRNLDRGKTVTIPGWSNKLTLYFLSCLPRLLRPKVTAWFYKGYAGDD